MTSGLYNFVSAEELPFYNNLSQEQKDQVGGQMVLILQPGQERPIELTTYQNSVNGIMNTSADALVGGLARTQEEGYTPGTAELTLLYNPTHGLLSDILEAGVDKFLPWQTGASRQAGESMGVIVDIRGNLGTNIVAHSQGVATVTSALDGNAGAMFADIRDNYDIRTLPVTYVGYGGAVSHTTYASAIGDENGQLSGAYANPGDIVSELVSLNQGDLVPPNPHNPVASQPESLNIFQGIGATFNSLWNGNMPEAHSYTCRINCGNQPPSQPPTFQTPPKPPAQSDTPLPTPWSPPSSGQSGGVNLVVPLVVLGSDDNENP